MNSLYNLLMEEGSEQAVEFWRKIYRRIMETPNITLYQIRLIYNIFRSECKYINYSELDYANNFIDLIDLLIKDLENEEDYEMCGLLLQSKKYIEEQILKIL